MRLRMLLQAAGAPLREGVEADASLDTLRAMYEPYVQALSHHLLVDLPPWIGELTPDENWHDERASVDNSVSPFGL